MKKIKELYEYRFMLACLIRRDLRTRYKNSYLGFLWTLILPLSQLLIYYFVFTMVFKNEIDNFPVFLYIGIMPWNYLVRVMNTSVLSIVQNSNLVKKIYFPREILPISIVGAYLVDFLISFVLGFVVVILFGVRLTIKILWFPLILIVFILFLLGIAFLLSALYVRMRDLAYIVNIGIMMWFYVTPIVYDVSTIGGWAKQILVLNPMTGIISSLRNILLYGESPETFSFLISVVASLTVFFAGFYIFDRNSKTFAEVL